MLGRSVWKLIRSGLLGVDAIPVTDPFVCDFPLHFLCPPARSVWAPVLVTFGAALPPSTAGLVSLVSSLEIYLGSLEITLQPGFGLDSLL
jgi:hypothetical protein